MCQRAETTPTAVSAHATKTDAVDIPQPGTGAPSSHARAAGVRDTDRCPSCSRTAVQLSEEVLLVGQVGRTGQVELVGQRVCLECAALSREHRLEQSLVSRAEAGQTAAPLLLSFLVRRDVPTHLVAEQIASTFPSVGGQVRLRAIDGQVALLVEQVTPAQFTWLLRLLVQGYLVAVGLQAVSVPHNGMARCACGHLLRSLTEQERRQCLECGLQGRQSETRP